MGCQKEFCGKQTNKQKPTIPQKTVCGRREVREQQLGVFHY